MISLEHCHQKNWCKLDERKKPNGVSRTYCKRKYKKHAAMAYGTEPTLVRCVDVDKGDDSKYNVRCRLVGKDEMKVQTKGASELFSTMPPRETVEFLLSFLVADEVSELAELLEIGIFDISRAHFMQMTDRELYIELRDEAKAPGEGDGVGRLNRSVCGSRAASNNWMRDWQKLLQ